MSGKDSIAKIEMLKNSLRCFVFGLVGLLPIIGFPFAIVSLLFSAKVRTGQKHFWNAARPYWIGGLVFSGLGILFSLTLAGIIFFHAELELRQ